MTETAQFVAWFPEVGDVVTFTALPPNAVNCGRRYVITGVRGGAEGNEVTYRPEWRRNWLPCMDYAGQLGKLWLSGMVKAES